jgi:hypothetical protein
VLAKVAWLLAFFTASEEKIGEGWELPIQTWLEFALSKEYMGATGEGGNAARSWVSLSNCESVRSGK